MLSKIRYWLERVVHKLNPCNAPEDSIVWGIVSTIFPDGCWCCIALRGMIYGIILTSAVFLTVG